MPRFMGTETEYGISTPTDPMLSPIVTSTHAVVAFAGKDRRAQWDFGPESPLKDSRGFDLRRYHTVPTIDPDALGVANVMTANGSRFYVDHAHPEYSAPETTNAFDAMLYDAAGDVVLNQAVAAVATQTAAGRSVLKDHDPCPPLKIYKNNVDGKGASYGAHENYMYSRGTDFEVLAQALIPFFVARQVITGAGRVGIGPAGQTPGFQISQRADYIEQEISLETTLNRGIINTRDEPHTDAERWGRLHVIIGDANMSHTAMVLKLGMTSLVLDSIESGTNFTDLRLVDPVGDVRRVSRDLQCTARLTLVDGRELTAIDILRAYRDRVSASSDVDEQVLRLWDEVMDLLADDPLSTSHLLDWTAKYALLNSYANRGVSWDDPKMALIDLQYSDIDPAKSLYHALVRKNRMRTLVSAEQIAQAAAHPPADSRAFFRGHMMTRFRDRIAAANWDSIVVELADGSLVRILMTNLGGLTKQQVAAMCDTATTVDDLVAALRSAGLTEFEPVT
ncbi:depupylase/deamidase Dop [Corynebacterium durum]|jgi:proteasome accessory factor pafA2|uniref:depupylase/deamidase Dop n=1 Tax=Corynebacterium durum TaxID=61592 RepID=UPI00288081A5|nr:depupylase/deamidase Dop [Corynebacterium durum]